MKTTALDVYNTRFKKRFRGYDAEQVDSFLEAIARGLEELTKENKELSEQLKRYENQIEEHRRKEQSVYQALLEAHQYGEEAKSAATRESELILREAKFEANTIVQKAKAQVERIRQELMVLEHEKRRFIAEYRAFLDAHLKMLPTIEAPQERSVSEITALDAPTDEGAGSE